MSDWASKTLFHAAWKFEMYCYVSKIIFLLLQWRIQDFHRGGYQPSEQGHRDNFFFPLENCIIISFWFYGIHSTLILSTLYTGSFLCWVPNTNFRMNLATEHIAEGNVFTDLRVSCQQGGGGVTPRSVRLFPSRRRTVLCIEHTDFQKLGANRRPCTQRCNVPVNIINLV